MLDWIKSHPLYDVLIALGLFVVFYLIARSGGGASSGGGGVTYVQSGPSDAVQTAQLAASAQVQQTQAALTASTNNTQAQLSLGEAALTEKAIEANLGAGVAQSQLAAQVQMAGLNTQGQVDVANIQTQGQVDIANTAAATQGQIAAAQFAAQTQINHDQVAGQVAIAGYSSATTIQTNHDNDAAQIAIANANLQGFLGQVGASVQMNQANNDAQVARDKIAADASTTVAGYQRDVNLAGIAAGVTTAGYQKDVNLANINAGVTIAGDETSLYSQALNNEAQANQNDYALGMYQTSSWMNYVTQLTQLKAYGKDTTGLPGTGSQPTPQAIAAGQPSTASQIISSIGNLAAGVGKGLAFAGI